MRGADVVVEQQHEELQRLRLGQAEALSRSVDEYEVAVLLETDGVTDELAVERYGRTDVFDVARALWETERQEPGHLPAPQRPDWYVAPWAALLRGLVFVTAGLFTMTAVALGAGTVAAGVVLVVNVIGIAMMQAFAFLAYLAMERAEAAPRAAVRPMLVVYAVPVPVAGGVAFALGAQAGLLVGLALAYLIGMVVVLVLGEPVVVAVVVLPAALVAWPRILDLADTPTDSVVVATWGIGAIVLALAALVLTRSRGQRRPPTLLGKVDLRGSVPFALGSLAAGSVVLVAVVGLAPSPILDGQTQAWAIAALPFLVPISLAELLVVQARRYLLVATGTECDPERFDRLATNRIMRLWSEHVVVVVLCAVAAWMLLPTGAPGDRITVLVVFAALATLLTSSLLLVSSDTPETAAVVLGGGAVAAAAVVATLRWTDADALWALAAVLALAAIVAGVASSRAARQLRGYR